MKPALALILGLAACGSDPATASSDATTDTAATADSADSVGSDATDATDALDTEGQDADAVAPTLPTIDKALYFTPEPRDGVAVQPALAWGDDERLLVAWTGAVDDALGIYSALFEATADGVTIAVAPGLVSTDTQGLRNEPAACALAGGGYALAWSVDRQDGADNLGVDFRRLDADARGLDAADQHLVTARGGNHWLADVACRAGGGFALTGVRNPAAGTGFEVFVAPRDAAGNADGDALAVFPREVGGEAFPAIAAGLGAELWVAWEDTPEADAKTVIALRRVAPTMGERRVVAASVSLDAQAPVLAVDPVSGHVLAGGVVGTKLRLVLEIGAPDLVELALPEAADAVTTVAAAVPLAVDRFGVLWFRGTGAEVDVRYAELVDGAFGPVATLANGRLPLAYRPALAARGDRVAAAWTESVGGGHYAVRAAVFARGR